MPRIADVLSKPPPPPVTAGRFEVSNTSPFQVYLDGGSVAVDAMQVDGPSYSVRTTGMYLLIQGHQPVCLPTI